MNRRLKAVCWVLAAVLLAECAFIAYLVASSQPTAIDAEPVSVVEVRDAPATEPPLYYQADERWGGLPYATAEGTVATHGCGLCCAAMAASWLTGEEVTPPVLLNLVGNRCIDSGVNHMGRFCEELRGLYGVEHRDLWTLADAEEHLRGGWMLFAGMGGSVYEGGREYGAHVLLVWGCDEDGVYIRDPADVTLQAPVSWEQFREIGWGSYFYAIKEG